MATYIISYDLKSPGKDYEELIGALKSYETWWHHLGSTWCVVTTKTAAEVRNHLKKYLDGNDMLLVVKSGGEGAWTGFNESGSAWLKKHL